MHTGESETAQAVVAQDEPKTTPPAEPETVQAVVTLDEPETANIRKDAEQEDEPIYRLSLQPSKLTQCLEHSMQLICRHCHTAQAVPTRYDLNLTTVRLF